MNPIDIHAAQAEIVDDVVFIPLIPDLSEMLPDIDFETGNG